jgi:hypothetical protein
MEAKGASVTSLSSILNVGSLSYNGVSLLGDHLKQEFLILGISISKEKLPLRDATWIPDIRDQGGRRSGLERRKNFIPRYKPERRSGQDRRKSQERRNRYDPEAVSYLKRSMDRYMEYANTHKGMAYGLLLSLPIWVAIILFIVVKLWV